MTMSTFGPTNSSGPYLPTEQDFPEDNKLFREILSQRERLTASSVNLREIAQYEKTEIQTGQQWFTTITNGAQITSYVYRLTFDLVALNGGVPIPIGTTTLALSAISSPSLINVPTNIQFVHCFGEGFNGTNWFSVGDPNFYIRRNNWTNVLQQIIITNTTGATLTTCTYVVEYIKT